MRIVFLSVLLVFILMAVPVMATGITASTATYLEGQATSGSLLDTRSDDGNEYVIEGTDTGLFPETTYYPSADITFEWRAPGTPGCKTPTFYDCVNDGSFQRNPPSTWDTSTYITTGGLALADATARFNISDFSLDPDASVIGLYFGIVVKQNQTTGGPAQNVQYSLIEANGTECWSLITNVTDTDFTSHWYGPFATCGTFAWTETVIDNLHLQVVWKAPYYHTISITAMAISVIAHEPTYNVAVYLNWTAGGNQLTFACDATDPTGISTWYIQANGIGTLAMDWCIGGDAGSFDVSAATVPLSVLIVGESSNSPLILRLDMLVIGEPAPSPYAGSGVGLSWVVLIALICGSAIYVSYKVGKFIHGE